MNPEQLKYTEDHEWIGNESGGQYVVGITGYAQEQLGDITYVELPEVGREVRQHEETAVVESVKAVGEVYAPVSGRVSGVNKALETQPELVNKDPLGAGWFFTLEDVDTAQVETLMSLEEYEAFLRENTKE